MGKEECQNTRKEQKLYEKSKQFSIYQNSAKMLLSCVFVEAQTKMSSSSRENAKTSLSLALIAAKLHLHTSNYGTIL